MSLTQVGSFKMIYIVLLCNRTIHYNTTGVYMVWECQEEIEESKQNDLVDEDDPTTKPIHIKVIVFF